MSVAVKLRPRAASELGPFIPGTLIADMEALRQQVRFVPQTDIPIAPRKYRARHMHIIVNHETVGARNEGATRA
jgi:hypothetical protein